MADSSSIVVAAWGLRYQPYVARWWESVESLNVKPDEIVLATNLDDPCGLLTTIPDWVDIPIIKVQVDSDNHNFIWSEALHATTKDWLIGIGIDDQFHPQALDFLAEVEGDLVIDKCKFLQGGEWAANWDLSNTHNRHFAPAGVAPFRRNLLDFYDQVPADCQWNDYVFYLLAAKAGVKVFRTDNYRMIHDLGDDHETISGRNANKQQVSWADSQLAAIRKDMAI